jgi:ketopantoate reductase
VKDIFSEIFIKAINSLAFNMIALKYNQNNFQLNKNLKAKKEIIEILIEGDKILKINNIKVYQTPSSRIIQTLKSSKHTMSMLHALQNKKKIELKDLWMSFRDLQKHMKFDMKKTEKIYNYLEKKLDGFI